MEQSFVSNWTLIWILNVNYFYIVNKGSIPIWKNLLKIQIFKFSIDLSLMRRMIKPKICECDKNYNESLVDTKRLNETPRWCIKTFICHHHLIEYSISWPSSFSFECCLRWKFDWLCKHRFSPWCYRSFNFCTLILKFHLILTQSHRKLFFILNLL